MYFEPTKSHPFILFEPFFLDWHVDKISNWAPRKPWDHGTPPWDPYAFIFLRRSSTRVSFGSLLSFGWSFCWSLWLSLWSWANSFCGCCCWSLPRRCSSARFCGLLSIGWAAGEAMCHVPCLEQLASDEEHRWIGEFHETIWNQNKPSDFPSFPAKSRKAHWLWVSSLFIRWITFCFWDIWRDSPGPHWCEDIGNSGRNCKGCTKHACWKAVPEDLNEPSPLDTELKQKMIGVMSSDGQWKCGPS